MTFQDTNERRPAGDRAALRKAGLLSFCLPFLLVSATYIVGGIYPFGPKQVLAVDLLHQYYPFLVEFQNKLYTGSSLYWTWNIGMGSGFLPLYAYYLASPLNLLLALAPQAFLREGVALLMAVRAGLAGLFCALLLRRVGGLRPTLLAALSACYALCGFYLGYCTNIIWLDTFALFPLVVLGVVRLLCEGKQALYVISLALAVWCSYYIAYSVCIFVALAFLGLCIIKGFPRRAVAKKLFQIAGYSLLAIGMTAVLLVPTYLAMLDYYPVREAFPSTLAWNHMFVDLIGRFAAMAPPTVLNGLPNLYTGMLPVLLLGLFAGSPGIPKREKWTGIGVLAFLILCCNVNVLDFIMHAFRYPHSFPARYTFLISLVLVMMAARAMGQVTAIGKREMACMLGTGLLVCACAFFGEAGALAAGVSLAFAAAYLLVLLAHSHGRLGRRVMSIALLCLTVLELGLGVGSSFLAVQDMGTERDAYPFRAQETRTLLARAQEEAPDTFFRLEISRHEYTANNPALLNYRGISTFSSTRNAYTAQFLKVIGLSGKPEELRYVYDDTSPLSSAFLGLRYFVARDGFLGDDGTHWEKVDQIDGVTLYENRYPLSLGFMAPASLLQFDGDGQNPFRSQNELFRLSTGLEGDLFTRVETMSATSDDYALEEVGGGAYAFTPLHDKEEGRLRWDVEIPVDGLYYACIAAPGFIHGRLGVGSQRQPLTLSLPYIQCIGRFAQGDSLFLDCDTVKAELSGEAILYVYRLDEALFARGYQLLADEQLEVTSWTDTEVNGVIRASQPGLLYTSISYEPGWSAYVDGVRQDILLTGNAMLSVVLEAGEHTVRFAYHPWGLEAGMAVSAVCLAVFVLSVVLKRKRAKA